MHAIRRRGMLIDHIVINGSDGRHAIHQARNLLQVFTDSHASHSRFNAVIVRAREFLCRIAFRLRIEGVTSSHTAAKPNRNHMFGFATDNLGGNPRMTYRCRQGTRTASSQNLSTRETGEGFVVVHTGPAKRIGSGSEEFSDVGSNATMGRQL
jgi:hypothetical protein